MSIARSMTLTRRRLAALSIAVTATLAAGGALAQTVSLAHAKGTLNLPATPKRVVVFDLATLDSMQLLGLPVAGVPKAQYPAYMAGYGEAKYTVAGSLFEPDYEALSQIRPDLIIVGGRSAAKHEYLSKIAPTADFSVRKSHMVEDITRNVTQLGHVFGRQAQAKVVTDKIATDLTELRALSAKAAPGLLLMAINERIAPQAPDARFGFLFDVLGAQSAITAKDVPPRGTAYTFADVAKLNPEWIYVIDRNTGTGSAAGGGEIIPSTKVFDNAQIKATKAGQKGQVVFLDPKGWYLMGSTGPQALLGNIKQLKDAYLKAGIR